jgi:hypothetical protein
MTEARRQDYNRDHPYGSPNKGRPWDFERPVDGHVHLPALYGKITRLCSRAAVAEGEHLAWLAML